MVVPGEVFLAAMTADRHGAKDFRRGEERVLKWIAECDDVNDVDEHGCTLLQRACQNHGGGCALARALLARGARLDVGRHSSALHNASASGDAELVTILLRAGASATGQTTGEKFPPLLHCIDRRLAGNHDWFPFAYTFDVMRLLLRAGASLDYGDAAGKQWTMEEMLQKVLHGVETMASNRHVTPVPPRRASR